MPKAKGAKAAPTSPPSEDEDYKSEGTVRRPARVRARRRQFTWAPSSLTRASPPPASPPLPGGQF